VDGGATWTYAGVNGLWTNTSDNGVLVVRDSASSVTVNSNAPTSFVYNGSAQGPDASHFIKSGSSNNLVLTYQGRAGTAYGPNPTAPTNVGSYTVEAFVPYDDNFAEAFVRHDFAITKKTPTVTVTPGTYTYNGLNQGPGEAQVNKDGSTGAVTLNYAGTTFGGVSVSSTNLPVEAGNYTVTATVAADDNHESPSPSPAGFLFSIDKANAQITAVPTAAPINAGQALSASDLTGGTGSPAGGSFAWTDPNATPAVGTASYSVTYTPSVADQANYQAVTANVSVTVSPAGESIGNFLPPGTPTNAETVGKYLIGGATNFTAASERPMITTNSTNLTLTAIVRTNDANYSSNQVVGQWVTNVSLYTNLGANSNVVFGQRSANQAGVQTGFERRDFTASRTFTTTNSGVVTTNTNSRLFLRLKATLQP